MIRTSCKLALALSVLVQLVAPASGQATHKDSRLGFELKPPRGWTQIPIRPDETWIVAKYKSEEKDRGISEIDGRVQYWHQPEMLVVAFTGQAPPDDDAEHYRDYKAYLKGTYERGYFVEEEETKTHRGSPVTRMEIKVDNGVAPEIRIETWVFETEVGDIAVHIECFADARTRLKSAIRRTMKSFKVIPRTEAVEASTSAERSDSASGLASLSPAERKKAKVAEQRREWEQLADGLPKKEGWKAKEIDGVLVLSHVDDKYTKEVVGRVNAVRKWLDATFPHVGPDEFARPPLVRICEDREEENAFRDGSGTFWVDSYHLVTHKAPRTKATYLSGRAKGNNAWEWEYVASRTLAIWFLERDAELWAAMPEWVRAGLLEVASAAKRKGSKLEFEKGDREKFRKVDLSDADDRLGIQRLLTMTEREFDSSRENGRWATWQQAVSLTRFFVASRTKKYREILPTYVANARAAIDEFEEQNPAPDTDAEPETEEEEEALIEARRARARAREQFVLDRALGLTFGDWDKGDWQSLERAFGRAL